MAVLIHGISPGSPAEKSGLKPGMSLVSINGREISDGLDYEFYSSSSRLDILATSQQQELRFKIKKEEYQPLGCEFQSYLIDKHHSCKNKCIFCFIDQLPKGMRKQLYFKDDDERLSFLFGNYITLTNLTEKEVNRIIEMRISPVNISVHTSNPELRAEMMGNRFAGDVLRFIPMLAKAGISINTQLVLCPGVNDGDELVRSINWLEGFYPSVQSIAAVPVGLTKHREGLYELQPYNKTTASKQLDIMLEQGSQMLEKHGSRLIFPADEWFLMAEREIPPEDFYEGYMQLENGVGMWRLMYEEFTSALQDTQQPGSRLETDVVTGVSAAPLLELLSQKLKQTFPDANMAVHAVVNDFFGHGVTVAGLVTGTDIIAQLKGRLHSDMLLLPSCMLRSEGDIMLDGTSVAQLEQALETTVKVISMDGGSLLDAALGIDISE